MSSDHSELIQQFCDVTGVDEERSRFFLESSNWQLDIAISSFFEHSGPGEENVGSMSAPLPTARPVVLSDSSDGESPPRPVPVVTKKNKGKNVKSSGNVGSAKFATLTSLQHSSSSDDEEGEAFYAGGSVRSGQQILGPGKNKNDIVTEMFKSVRERGAVATEPVESRGQSAFSGAGYRLGANPDDNTAAVPVVRPGNQEQVRSVRLQLYRNGFAVDGGPLRSYDDPPGAAFLEYVKRGEVPPELSQGMTGGELRIQLEDHRQEDYNASAPTSHCKPFSGKGYMLGSPTPPTVGITSNTLVEASDRLANERAAQANVGLDEAQPVTTVQFRLADGGRLTGRFNHNHTVANLRDYITTAVPTYQLQSFILMTTFPNKELDDPTLTLEQGELLNSLVVQRLK